MNPFENRHIRELAKTSFILVRWIFTGILVGLILGVAGALFSNSIRLATAFRIAHDRIIWLLPFAGLGIVFLYRLLKDFDDKGTNLVINSISHGDRIPFRKAPLIFIATVLTHLFGGSSGRESAALQLGGSIAQTLGRFLRLDDSDLKIITMSGMSAAFAALFGAPMTAAIFAIEISSIGIFYYSALVPCVFSALVASAVAQYFGAEPDAFFVHFVPDFLTAQMLYTALFAILCALLSGFFCICLHQTGYLYKRFFPNPYFRIFAGGLLIAALTFLSGTRAYNGAGMDIIRLAAEGQAPYPAFLLKILFTSLTLGAGYKGGEIVPSLYIGATFGCLFSQLFGFPSALCAAIGMGALFCGVTNCPISSLLLCFELFGYSGMPYYLIAIALSYTFSGYYSVYSAQKIVYSKIQNKYVNHETH